MACKFGYADIVRFIVSLPCADRYKKNGSEETPDQVCLTFQLRVISFLLD